AALPWARDVSPSPRAAARLLPSHARGAFSPRDRIAGRRHRAPNRTFPLQEDLRPKPRISLRRALAGTDQLSAASPPRTPVSTARLPPRAAAAQATGHPPASVLLGRCLGHAEHP